MPARGLDLQTTTPGFDVTIYGAETSLPTSIESGWTEVASEEALKRRGRIDLDTATFAGRGHTRLLQLQHLIDTGQLDDELFWRKL